MLLFAAPGMARAQGQYKRVHQDALSKITSGKTDVAIEDLKAFGDKYPQDAETQFMLAVAYSVTKQLDEAAAAMERATALGLPADRFVAGPRDLLANLSTRPEFQSLKKKVGPLVQGPLVANVTGYSVDVWVRTADAAKVEIQVEPSGATINSTPATSSAESDFTAVAKVWGLEPQTRYRYTVLVDGEPLKADDQYFSTPVAKGQPSKFTLAFGGGAGFVPENERAWTTIAKQKPDLMLLLGDNTYSDSPESPQMQKYCYYRRQSRPEFRSLVAHTPTYTIWDDHDFGTNDCWGGPEIDKPAWKRPVWNVFRQNWANPGYGGDEPHPGCWYSFSRGDVDFIMLDGRYYRTSPKVNEPSMLGPVQLAWLKKQLLAAKGTFKVICSPVPWDYRTKGDSSDTWNGFKAEREAIFSFLTDNKIEGVLLMSADRHRSDAWLVDRPGTYALYEFNSSRLTNQHVHPEMKAAIFSYNKKQSFGLVHFNTTEADPTVKYEVVTIDGDVVHDLEVKRSQLQ
jgi:alkaline phosphatase D